ncbi:MAG TPA: hypothetical protein VF762_04605 [Blastocatellia bacterium]|jgi:hypothetical protein
MDCRKFEDSITDYLDGSLKSPEAIPFLAHSLQCRSCRALLDEVKATLHDCKVPDELAAPSRLEVALLTIVGGDVRSGCMRFEELITEFLDGFVPAAVYHGFEEHADGCGKCSSLLTGVVYAVAACHSVHTYEEVEAPETLLRDLVSIMPDGPRHLKSRFAERMTGFVNAIIPRATHDRRWTFATAASLAFATFAFLLLGFSDDRTIAGIYRQAHVKFAELYSQGTSIYSRKDELAASFERVGKDIGEIWDTLGGEAEPNDRRARTQKRRNTGTAQPAGPAEKN